ncbi:MAG TPA: hypothetical protein VNQ79_00200 [Blastocatellia bacterium]|nr:hypothetical protein [Blastocatellia bacterium]
MNLYFYVEGKRTEPKVYRSWLGHAFPHLTEVQTIADVKQNHYLMISGFGYPQCLNRIGEILQDIERHGAIDHFFVCIDAEEEPPHAKLAELEKHFLAKAANTNCPAIIHNCCFETWFLGHRQMMKRRGIQSQKLRQWKAFYDVSVNCPESMVTFPGYRIRAHFHIDYLKEMLSERGQTYSKQHPGIVQDRSYLQALIERHEKTGHIQSFGQLLLLWRLLGGNI